MERLGLSWFFLCVSLTHSVTVSPDPPLDHDPPLDPEVNMNISEIIQWWGFPAEEHEVETEDGYILTVNRIPQSSGGRSGVVLLQHGLLAAGSNWIINPPDSALGFFLSQNGFDVWMSNSRGNTWSRRHRSLDPDQDQFWAFSHDEMALKDLPAVINYILNTTQQQQLYYIGHSEGATIGFMAFSSLPDLADKVKLFVALAPVVTLNFAMSAMIKLHLIPESGLWSGFGRRDFVVPSPVVEVFAEYVCTNHTLCGNLFFVWCGFNEGNLNMSRTPVYTTHYPAGTSVQNIVHWHQRLKTVKFAAFDYGPKGNMEHYNQTSPPEYDVQKMTVPTAVFHGGRDILANPLDIGFFLPQISKLVYHRYIKHWDHLDFIWGLDAKNRMFPAILRLLRTY